MLLENDSFLSELTRLFQKSKTSGSLTLTMKKYDGRTKPKPKQPGKSLPEPSEYKCIVRASLGKKTISTIVSISNGSKGDSTVVAIDFPNTNTDGDVPSACVPLRAAADPRGGCRKVNQKDVNKFQLAYANVIKANMDGLKKKEKKSAKTKAKAI